MLYSYKMFFASGRMEEISLSVVLAASSPEQPTQGRIALLPQNQMK
jgi:hypothetical protein